MPKEKESTVESVASALRGAASLLKPTPDPSSPHPPGVPWTKTKDVRIENAEEAARRAKQSSEVPSMKEGGEVEKTGTYRLHKGEKVVPAKKKHAGHGYRRMHAEHHKDGSVTAHYEHEDGPESDSKHAAASLDHLHDSIEDHLGALNVGEVEADRGEHGIPDEHAIPAGLPGMLRTGGAGE